MVITAATAAYGNRPHRTQATLAAEEPVTDDFMAAMVVPERSKGPLTLPNFSSLPCFNVTWGRRKQLRCVKEDVAVDHDEDGDGDGDLPSSSSLHRRSSLTRSEFNNSDNNHHRKRRSTDDGGIGIEAMRAKLMLDFQAEVHQMQAAFLQKSDVVVPTTAPSPAVEPRPWNLRTRRAVCKEPNNFPASSDRKLSFSPTNHSVVKSPARRNNGEVNGGSDGGERPRTKFSGTLSKQEIEEDFLAILGTRPARRPKKRPKYVQRQIDAVFPGYWLSEISADMYKVNEQQQPKTG